MRARLDALERRVAALPPPPDLRPQLVIYAPGTDWRALARHYPHGMLCLPDNGRGDGPPITNPTPEVP
jgi:hypothetical protein